jgi:UDP-N-acetylmuramoylalanine--D-glutamate ligase
VAAAAKAAGVPIIGDIELLALAHRPARFVGITGTNGKSTTTALIAHICALDAGVPMAVGGNLGFPVVDLQALPAAGRYVLELSSYQLELAPSLACDVGILLNLSPDHLDRHGGMEGYVAAKVRLFDGQGANATAVIGVDDAWSRAVYEQVADRALQRMVPVSGQGPVSGGIYAQGGMLVDDTAGRDRVVMALSDAAALPGAHNHQNAAAAYAACVALGVPEAVIVQGLRSFPGLAHRQQRVGQIDGIAFVNDSKATNPDAASKALSCYGRIYWIAGGRAKVGASMQPMEPFLTHVREAFLIGEAEQQFADWLSHEGVAHQLCGTLEAATFAALAAARRDGAGGVVLLSPACASWDQFRNFEHRGDSFAALASGLMMEGVV